MSPAYDPKARRAHSPADADHAPVDDLLGAPAPEVVEPEPAPAPAPEPATTTPAPAEPGPTPGPARAAPPRWSAPTPAPRTPGPDPRIFAALAVVVAAVLVWLGRRRRRWRPAGHPPAA